jgi:uncharacterized integral membrane protein
VAEPAPLPGEKKAKRPEWKTWLAAGLGLLLVIFIGLNSQDVEVDFIFGTAEAPLIVALLIAGGLGALIGWLVPRVRRGKAD